MAGSGGGEKTEQATPKKRRDEQKKGNVFSSKDLVSAFFILIMFFSMQIFGKLILTTLFNCMEFWINLCDGSFKITPDISTKIITEALKTIVIVAGPMLLIGILVNVIFTGMQTRFNFSGEALKFKFSRLNPIEGIKKLFSIRSLVELVKSILKIAVIAGIIFNAIQKRMVEFAMIYDMDLLASVVYLCSAIFSTVMSIGVVFIFLGILDLLYQWWQHEKDMRMSKQEIKEEFKQMEGDPQLKAKIKQTQREISQRRMMAEIPKADVIIRNPTHYAVAIKYDYTKNNAPMVIAKGVDRVALKIIDIATKNNITMTENKPLARALYDEVKVGREILPEFYAQVAEILAWVYDIKGKKIPH